MSAETPIVELAGELSERDAAELEGDEDNPFDSDGRLVWRDKERFLAVRDADGRLAAAAGIVVATVVAGSGPPCEVVGIGGVIVRADRRGEGLARRVVQAALDRGAQLGSRFALLFCRSDRAGLYAGLGFTPVAGPVTVDQPGGPTTMHMETMWRALAADARWPDGPVRLTGMPF